MQFNFFIFLDFPIRKNIKSWNQICASVRDSRKRFNDACPSLPFNFNFRYDNKNEKLRVYFLSSQNSSETTLFYCDVPLVKQINSLDRSNGTIFEIEEDVMNKMRNEIQASEEAMQTGENDYESVDIGNESDEYRNYYEMDQNMRYLCVLFNTIFLHHFCLFLAQSRLPFRPYHLLLQVAPIRMTLHFTRKQLLHLPLRCQILPR